MSIKDKLKLFQWDKLSHYQWGSWFASLAATIVVVAVVVAMQQPVWVAALAGAIVSFATARTAGVMGENSDAKANAAAVAAGKPPPHEVSDADAFATTIGCLPSAVPLLAVAYIAFPK